MYYLTQVNNCPDLCQCDDELHLVGPKKPTLPPQYRVRIEGNIIESNYTQDIHEYFDSVNNLGAASQWIHGHEMKMLFLYPTGELITLQYDDSGSIVISYLP